MFNVDTLLLAKETIKYTMIGDVYNDHGIDVCKTMKCLSILIHDLPAM